MGPVNIPKVNQQKLPQGLKGNLETVKVMKKVAHGYKGHPKIRKLALNILNYFNTKPHHFADEAKAIGIYVQQKVRYVKDATGIEQLHSPLTIINQIENGIARADCDDMALLAATLLLSIGHSPKFRCVRYNSRFGNFNHIYVVDYARNKGNPPERVVIDAIIDDKPIGFEVPHKSGKEYQV